jgi:hypothetical protein
VLFYFFRLLIVVTSPPRAKGIVGWHKGGWPIQRNFVSIMANDPFECQRHGRNFGGSIWFH